MTITARDPDGLTAAQSFQVTVETPNRAPEPVGTIPSQEVEPGQTATLDVSSYFRDPDGDALTYTAATSAATVLSVSISGSTLTMVGVADGTSTVTVTARDPDGLTGEQSFQVTVETPNRAPEPVGTIPSQEVEPGQTATLDVSSYFRDPDGDALTYAAASSAAAILSVSISGSTLTMAGVAEGNATVTVTARDPGGLTAEQSASVAVSSESDFVPLSVLTITRSGGIRFGGISVGTGCFQVSAITLNGVTYTVHWSEWQILSGSDWNQVSGTRRDGRVCGYDLAAAAPGEYRLAGEMSVNGVRGRYRSSNTVTVGEGGGASFRDDFDSSASLDDWSVQSNADIEVAGGLLRITNNRDGFVGLVGRDLDDPLTSWTLSVSMGRAQRDGLAGVWWGTGIRRYPRMSFNVGPLGETNFSTWLWDDDQETWLRLTDLSGHSDAINVGPDELTEITLGWDGEEVFVRAGDTDLLRGEPDETLAAIMGHIFFVILTMEGDVGRTALFDWVEVTGTVASADMADGARPALPSEVRRVARDPADSNTATDRGLSLRTGKLRPGRNR
ncbi:MAG: hypothetical protein F4X23_04200 [Gemmatimonadales bacterium]|nr:hypothetical protein [Gemmatimonadales bacterium]